MPRNVCARRAEVRPPIGLAGAVLLTLGLGVSGAGFGQQADPDPVGIWDLKFGDQSQASTGRIPTSLLKVERVDGELEAQLTSIRDRFLPVDDLRVEGAAMSFAFGAYEYVLEFDGDLMTGSVVSPRGTEQVNGRRQAETLMYNRPEEFRTSRDGVIGHRVDLAPPEDEPDPAAWVLSRVQAPEDLALIVFLRNYRTAVRFVNAADFEEELRAHAGQRVDITAIWEGEELRLESIEAAAPENED